MTFTVTLDTRQERALNAAVAKHNATEGTALTVEEFFQLRTASYLEALVRGYEERVKNQMAENFEKLSPAEQAAILQKLGIVV